MRDEEKRLLTPLFPFVRKGTWCSYALVAICALMTALHGCGYTYRPISLRSRDGQVEYRCHTSTKALSDTFRTTVTKREGKRCTSLPLIGKAASMVLSPDGEVLAIALSCGSTITYRVVLIETADLKIWKQLPIAAAKLGPAGNTDDASTIVRFDCMALSDNSRMLATYYRKYSPRGGNETGVTLWDTQCGDIIRDLRLPEPDESFSLLARRHGGKVVSMAFSEGGSFLGVSGSRAWDVKDPDVEQPDGFIRVWRVSDGKDVATLRLRGRFCVWNVCLDHTGSYLAATSWGGQGTGYAQQVSVWHLAEGKEIARKVIVGRVRDTVWLRKTGVFKVYTAQNREVYVSPTKDLTSSRQMGGARPKMARRLW